MSEPRDVLKELVTSARRSISNGYYSVEESGLPRRSLRDGIQRSSSVPIIAEIKFASPSAGEIRKKSAVSDLAGAIERGGAVGISVLTEPEHFEGRIEYLPEVKRSVSIPVLMKDIIIDPVQIDAGRAVGADLILLIASIYSKGYCSEDLGGMIRHAHSRNLEVLLETHDDQEFESALKSDADLIGINNRNLSTMNVSIETSARILKKYGHPGKAVVCESGISTPDEIRSLSKLGADAFLIGSSIMRSKDVESSVRTFAEAK